MVVRSQGRLFGCNRCLSRRHQKKNCCRQKEGTTQGRDFPQTVPSKRRERLLPPNRRTCHVVPLVTVLPTTSECLELPRILPNAHSDPHAQRFSSVVLPLMTVRLPAVNRNVRKSGGNCQSNILVYFRRRRGKGPARLAGRCLSLDTSWFARNADGPERQFPNRPSMGSHRKAHE